jgi:hypothetical protein
VVAVSDSNLPDLKKMYKLQKNLPLNLVEELFVCGAGIILCCVEGVLEILFSVSYLIERWVIVDCRKEII